MQQLKMFFTLSPFSIKNCQNKSSFLTPHVLFHLENNACWRETMWQLCPVYVGLAGYVGGLQGPELLDRLRVRV